MLQDSVVESPPSRCGYAGSPSLSTWEAAGASAAWVHVAGEIDFTASLQLTQTIPIYRLIWREHYRSTGPSASV
jgi:hypothetical protein